MSEPVSREEFEKLQALVQNTRAQVALFRLELFKAGAISETDRRVYEVCIREVVADRRLALLAENKGTTEVDAEVKTIQEALELHFLPS